MTALTFNQAHNYCLTLPLQQGMIGVFGLNGSGKTHLLQSMAGIRDSANTLQWQGDTIAANALGNPCTYHAQHAQLLTHLNVQDNLTLVYAHSTWASQRRLSWQTVIDLCELAPNQGNNLLTRSVDSLSGGELQRVCLARTLLTGKPVLLLDEPFSALDPHTRRRLCNKLYQLQRDTALTIILVSHHMPELLCYCEHIIDVAYQRPPQLYSCAAFAQTQTTFNRIALANSRATASENNSTNDTATGSTQDHAQAYPVMLGEQNIYASVALAQAAIVIAQDACIVSPIPLPDLAHQANQLQGLVIDVKVDGDVNLHNIKLTIDDFVFTVNCSAYSIQALNLLNTHDNELSHRLGSTLYVYFPYVSGVTYT